MFAICLTKIRIIILSDGNLTDHFSHHQPHHRTHTHTHTRLPAKSDHYATHSPAIFLSFGLESFSVPWRSTTADLLFMRRVQGRVCDACFRACSLRLTVADRSAKLQPKKTNKHFFLAACTELFNVYYDNVLRNVAKPGADM